MKRPRSWPGLLLGALASLSAFAAYEAGGVAFTKRFETKLLVEPKPLAEPAGKLPYGRQVKVEEVKGAWLRVSAGAVAGWIFQGNLSATKPAEVKGLLDGMPQVASETTATAAARPLSTAAADYAAAKDLSAAQADLEWMIAECAALGDDDVTAYLQAQKKGEYQ